MPTVDDLQGVVSAFVQRARNDQAALKAAGDALEVEKQAHAATQALMADTESKLQAMKAQLEAVAEA